MNKKLIILFSLLSIVCMCTIFYLSSENSATSNDRSDGITDVLGKTIPDVLKKGVSKSIPTVTYEKSASYIIRKSAHFTLYGLLGLFLFLAFYYTKKKVVISLLFATMISFVYACTDEYHQSFTGRTSSFSDVLLDTLGAICTCLFFVMVVKIISLIKNKRIQS